MATPTPTSPTLNDLQYQSFSVNLPLGNNPKVVDGTFVTENIVLDFVDFTGLVNTSEFTTVSENVVVAPEAGGTADLDTLSVADTTTVTDTVDTLKAGARFVNISETITVTESHTPQ